MMDLLFERLGILKFALNMCNKEALIPILTSCATLCLTLQFHDIASDPIYPFPATPVALKPSWRM